LLVAIVLFHETLARALGDPAVQLLLGKSSVWDLGVCLCGAAQEGSQLHGGAPGVSGAARGGHLVHHTLSTSVHKFGNVLFPAFQEITPLWSYQQRKICRHINADQYLLDSTNF
jgi:hypothetical protein